MAFRLHLVRALVERAGEKTFVDLDDKFVVSLA